MRKVLILALSVAMAAMLLTGCQSSGGATPDGASYNMFTASMTIEEAGTLTEVHAATVKALGNLELPISYNKKDNLVAVVQTFTSAGDSIAIRIGYVTLDISEIRFTSDDRIDKRQLNGLLEEIRKNMSAI